LRDFGDGFVAVLLPVYLTALGFSPLEVGVIATVALLGSALLTLGIGLIGARHDYRRARKPVRRFCSSQSVSAVVLTIASPKNGDDQIGTLRS
jgi:MFS family permease